VSLRDRRARGKESGLIWQKPPPEIARSTVAERHALPTGAMAHCRFFNTDKDENRRAKKLTVTLNRGPERTIQTDFPL